MYFKKEAPETGMVMSYPRDYGFSNVCEIPEETARSWMDQIGYELNPGISAVRTWKHWADEEFKYNDNTWMNKLAVVVEVNHFRIMAVYKHDWKIWIVQLDRR